MYASAYFGPKCSSHSKATHSPPLDT
jgi:hypothetical protein